MKFTFATEPGGFDSHIEKSIRGYEDLYEDVIQLSKYFVEDGSIMVDVGCSTGRLLRQICEKNKATAPKAKYIGIEIEEDFYVHLDESLDDQINYFKGDVKDFRFENCALVSSIFSLQFMSKKDRTEVVRKIFRALNPGGAFIFAEKTVAQDPRIQEMTTFIYFDYKKKFFTESEILKKEERLRAMMKPNRTDEIINMCKESGFSCITPIWQNFNFIAWIALK